MARKTTQPMARAEKGRKRDRRHGWARKLPVRRPDGAETSGAERNLRRGKKLPARKETSGAETSGRDRMERIRSGFSNGTSRLLRTSRTSRCRICRSRLPEQRMCALALEDQQQVPTRPSCPLMVRTYTYVAWWAAVCVAGLPVERGGAVGLSAAGGRVARGPLDAERTFRQACPSSFYLSICVCECVCVRVPV